MCSGKAASGNSTTSSGNKGIFMLLLLCSPFPGRGPGERVLVLMAWAGLLLNFHEQGFHFPAGVLISGSLCARNPLRQAFFGFRVAPGFDQCLCGHVVTGGVV